jgi:hypothetical protein
MLIVFYVSSHGYGHASRSIEVIKALALRRPDTRVIVRSAVPRWFFDAARLGSLQLEPLECDTGVAQIDSLTIDEADTARRAASFYADFDRRADGEAEWLRSVGASLVLGDVPPLAFAAADRARCPSIAIANFTWDWIYEGFSTFERLASGALPRIRRAYGHATAALRLPLSGGFEAMTGPVTDIPLIARRSFRDRGDTRRLLQVPDNRPLVLASFGAYGARFAREALSRDNRLTLVPVDHPACSELQYQDLVAAADVVVSKPGYGIVSECAANGASLLYTSRGRFREYDVLVAEMPRVLRCRYLSPDDFKAGNWAPAVESLLAQPPLPVRARIDGADLAAQLIPAFS